MSSSGSDNPDINNSKHRQDEVRLYGQYLSDNSADGQNLLQSLHKKFDINIEKIVSIGVIYGYAHEGHCYKLPRPQIMLLPQVPQEITDGDCGYRKDLGYFVWQIDKLNRAVVLDVRSDDVKSLVLDANTPGNRSPLAYAQVMALAPHRSSRD